MNFARFVSAQSRAILVMTFLLCAAGLYAAYQLPVSIFPQTNFPRVVVVVDNGVVPGNQQLASVTRPIEEAMGGIPGVNRVTSVTARGATEINLFFDWDGRNDRGKDCGSGVYIGMLNVAGKKAFVKMALIK